MIYGPEYGTVYEDEWSVPYKFYKLTKFSAFLTSTNDKIRGFRLEFTPDSNIAVSGWSTITRYFGVGPGNYVQKDLDLSSFEDVSEVSFCVTQEAGWFARTKSDIE